MNLLLIEEEINLCQSTLEYLKQNGFNCEAATNSEQGFRKAELFDYDCVIADIHLSSTILNRLKVLRSVNPNSGIIIISSLNDIETKVKSFDLGADDYMIKPFHVSELDARIKSVLRRKKFEGQQVITLNEIKIFPEEFKVLANGEELKLTRGEYKLLLYLVSKRNKVVTKTALAEQLWAGEIDHAASYDFVYSHIKNLRKRLNERGCPDYIKTVYGVGYNFKVN